MRRPAPIKPWLSAEDLQTWVGEAGSRDEYQKRLAIWLTIISPLSGSSRCHLARCLQAGGVAVGQAIQSAGGGGFGARRAPLGLSWEQEEAFPAGLEERAQKGQILRAPQMHPHLCQATGQKVSLAYVYRLLHRHHGRKLGPRPRHVKADRERQEEFKKDRPRSSGKR